MDDIEIINTIDSQPHKPAMEREELRDVISLALWAGQMLLQNGADTKRVEETVHHLGTGLGCDWLDVTVLPDAIIASTVNNHEFRTKVRRAPARGVNMQLIAEINGLSYRVDAGDIDRFQLRQALRHIDTMPHNYNRWLVVLAVGLACAAFSRLFAGDWPVFFVTWLAASTATLVRQLLHQRNFNHLLITIATAFIAGMVASSAAVFNLSGTPATAIAASVLLLVPGIALINAAEDLLNGHILNGVMRGVTGVLVALAIALGLSLVFWLTGISSL